MLPALESKGIPGNFLEVCVMIHKLNVEKEDFDRLEEIKPLVSAFNRAVQFSLAATPEARSKIAAITTPEDNREFMEIAEVYQSFADQERYYNAEQARSIHTVMALSLKDHFMSIVRRAVTDQKLAAHVPAELANERNIALLDKYKLPALAAVVRAAAPGAAVN